MDHLLTQFCSRCWNITIARILWTKVTVQEAGHAVRLMSLSHRRHLKDYVQVRHGSTRNMNRIFSYKDVPHPIL